jgi:hypothetical protein
MNPGRMKFSKNMAYRRKIKKQIKGTAGGKRFDRLDWAGRAKIRVSPYDEEIRILSIQNAKTCVLFLRPPGETPAGPPAVHLP